MKYFKFLTLMLVILLTMVEFVYCDSAPKVSIDKSLIGKGIVSLSCVSDKTIKVIIEKADKKYTYDLKNNGKKENFPLQLGNGDYSITVLENIINTKYSAIYFETVNLNIKDNNAVFLGSIQNINWNRSMKSIVKSKSLTKNKLKDSEKISIIYNYVIKNYKYDYKKAKNVKSGYIPAIDRTYIEKKGICYDYSSLLASMLRSSGIPTRLVKGYSDNINGYHAWNEVYLKSSGKWVTVDTTYDSIMKLAKQRYKFEKNGAIYSKSYLY